jgi:hypothetical protein
VLSYDLDRVAEPRLRQFLFLKSSTDRACVREHDMVAPMSELHTPTVLDLDRQTDCNNHQQMRVTVDVKVHKPSLHEVTAI